MNGCKDDQSVRTDLPVSPNLRLLYLSIRVRVESALYELAGC